jgi:hypothetical protein
VPGLWNRARTTQALPGRRPALCRTGPKPVSEYPEHERLHAIKDKSQAIGEFLDFFLPSKGIVLMEKQPRYDDYVPIRRSIYSLLAEFFNIDQDKLDAEKKAMLTVLREANDEHTKGDVDGSGKDRTRVSTSDGVG